MQGTQPNKIWNIVMFEKASKLKDYLSLKRIRVVISFLVGFILGYILGTFRISAFFYFTKISVNFSWLDDLINNSIWRNHSSYNLGVAITAIAIVVAFIEFISNKRELRFSLNYRKRKLALWLAIISIALVFLGELDGFFLGFPFIFEIGGAMLMVIAIAIYLYVILNPLKRLNKKQISILQDILTGTLSNSHLDKHQTIRGCIELFENLLDLSLDDKDVQSIFRNDFASDVFIKHFSESYFVFGRTVDFYREKKKAGKHDLYHIEFFLKRLITKSLENSESFLNMFIGQKIYPNALFCLDDVMINEKDTSLLRVLFGEYRFNGLDSTGQLNYIALVTRYFKLVYQENNHVSLKDGYKKNYGLNDELINIFFKEIVNFLESCYDQKQLEMLLDKITDFSCYYRLGVKTNDKSGNIRKNTGKFLYDIFYNFISKYKIEEEEIFRLKVYQLYDHFLEIQKKGFENNVAYDVFVEKLKGKILGEGKKDEYMPNYKGYFPAMILIYFYMFGFYVFSEKQNEAQAKDLHIPIFSKLAEAFPKLYQGFKQEFYDAKTLPEDKRDLLEKQGREILDRFLPKNIVYNFKENSLSYYYSGNIHSSKIFLNKVKDNQEIKAEKI
jgi:hypothetical protein